VHALVTVKNRAPPPLTCGEQQTTRGDECCFKGQAKHQGHTARLSLKVVCAGSPFTVRPASNAETETAPPLWVQ
jgi:hypothetical protein